MSDDQPKYPLKRKTLKLSHPNPLFEMWLKEWRDEAASRNSDTQHAFGKALRSLKKYPLPLKTGKECLILENFGTRICLLLDRKLADYKKNQSDTSYGVLQHQVEANKPHTTESSRITSYKSNLQSDRNEKIYIPTLRSASYAVLLALYSHLKNTGSPGEMTKSELQKAAQPLCDTSMFKSLPGSYYTGWSSVGKLVNKGLVCRHGNPHRYGLTKEGINLAEKLPDIDLEPSICYIPKKRKRKEAIDGNKKMKTTVNSPIKKCNKTTENTGIQELYTQLLDTGNQIYNKDSFEQKSPNTLHDQKEGGICLPGSFQIILLVDTQEIHRGDEMVKELKALGVQLEVRKLKVGDFVWVSRDEQGLELLLPYIIERKRLDDLASSIKDGRFHEQKFRMKQCGIPNCIYLVESHGQRQYSLPTATLMQAAANTQFIDKFTVKYTANSHETVIYLATFTQLLTRKFSKKTLLSCGKSDLPTLDVGSDCISLISFKEFNKISGKTKNYSVKEMFIKQLVQLRGLSVEKALAIVERYPCPWSLLLEFEKGVNEKLLADIPVGSLSRKIGPVISKVLYELYNKPVLQ